MSHDHDHSHRESTTIIKLPRSVGGFIAVPVEELGCMSTFSENVADDDKPVKLVHHFDQTLVFVKCISESVIVEMSLPEVLSEIARVQRG